ncbi:MAG: helix-turn-helix domain-containing protein [Flavobacteriaceae bacterium]|nr:helix-turn-helix domain-containing protein [Flavobacteriaceae bacterium]MDG1962300.1 helix-turn-helix domain-containing protein [Flavobacteriaceae bacterium]
MIQEIKEIYGHIFEAALIKEIAQVGLYKEVPAHTKLIEIGNTCSMTMNYASGQTKSEIRAITETDTVLIMVPIQKMEEWTLRYKSWRNFVFESYHNRLNEMLHTMDSIAFDNMEERLFNYLKEKARVNQEEVIRNTHQEMTYDLHSSRVVISRLLKKMEQNGQVSLQRNSVKVLNLEKLCNLGYCGT